MSGYSNTRQLFDKAIARLTRGTGIFDPAVKASADETTVLVYNGLSWARGGLVELDRLPAALRDSPLEVVDHVTNDVLRCGDIPGTSRRVLFYAPAIPATGYRLFTLRPSTRTGGMRDDFPLEVVTDEQGWIDAPNVMLTALKPAEGHPQWFVIRIQEIGGETGVARVTTPFAVRDAVYANTVESRSSVAADLNHISVTPWQTITSLARIERRAK